MGEPEEAPSSPLKVLPPALIALAVLLCLEAVGVAVLLAFELVSLFTERPESYASAIALALLAVIAVLWGLITAAFALRRRRWIRGSAVTWQILQLAVAVGSFQGVDARPDIGWMLAIPAVIGIVLAVSKPVVRATEPEPDAEPERASGSDANA